MLVQPSNPKPPKKILLTSSSANLCNRAIRTPPPKILLTSSSAYLCNRAIQNPLQQKKLDLVNNSFKETMETLSASLHNGGVKHLRKSSIVGKNIRNQRNKIAAVYIRKWNGLQSPTGDSISLSRAQWQSSCAILTSNAVAQQQETEKPANGALVPVNDSAKKEFAITMLDGLSKPLTIVDFSPAPMHGNELRVAYRGMPGAYTEAAASKAYPSCEAVPCDQFEVVFQAVELWLADRAVLPVESSSGGSVHRNYDLMLRHRLHIVGLN